MLTHPEVGVTFYTPKLFDKPYDLCVKLYGVKVPCKQCTFCRLKRSQEWAIRCMHESQLHEHCSFLTLTYNNDHLPEGGTLDKRHIQLFIKRYRKKFGQFRYYYCGEYGDKLGRPHYHLLIFGHEFEDQELFKTNHGNDKLYTSPSLDKLWGKGYAVIGELTFQSAAYVARYIMKKITGSIAKQHYERIDESTGEILQLVPEYNDMSRRPGIASGWFDQFSGDCYPKDFLTYKGRKLKPPAYYDALYKRIAPESYDIIKADRLAAIMALADDNTPARLAVKAIIHKKQAELLIRPIHSD